MLELTDEQRDIQRLCRDFAAREIRPISLAVDEADIEWPREIWHKASEIGLTAFMLPTEYGGAGMTDCVTSCLVGEELSHGCSGIGNLITSNGFFAEPVLALGDEQQKQRWLSPLAGDDPPLTALAITEPESGSDAASIRTRAKRQDGGYVISGQKAWIFGPLDRRTDVPRSQDVGGICAPVAIHSPLVPCAGFAIAGRRGRR